ncbi:hypothetical protein Tco_0702131 [Tanacetum coccineum]|uniref:Uncharacterized protein n=1 Tax=Tanacetum coccineum TaxID=301880 RepID=A0ABQ4XW60_9ASTR
MHELKHNMADKTVDITFDENIEKDVMADDSEMVFLGTINIHQAMKDVSSEPDLMPDDEIMSISSDDEEAESDKELSLADEVVADMLIDEILIDINTRVSTFNVFAAPTTEVPNVPDNKPIHTSSMANIQELAAKAP